MQVIVRVQFVLSCFATTEPCSCTVHEVRISVQVIQIQPIIMENVRMYLTQTQEQVLGASANAH